MAGPGNFWENLKGSFSSIFGIGGKNGPVLKDSSGVLEVRNSDDSAYQVARGASPVGDNDFTTKRWVLTNSEHVVIIDGQMDGGSPPAPSGAGFLVVTTAGGTYSIGEIVYDDGSTLENLGTVEGRLIFVTDSLTGGTISFDADSLYAWDADGSQWVKIGDVSNLTGARRTIHKAIDNSASQDTTTSIPAGNYVFGCWLEVTTPYSAGATISVGDTATADKFMGTDQNDPQTADKYHVKQHTQQVAQSVVRVTVGGVPAAGAGVLAVEFGAVLG